MSSVSGDVQWVFSPPHAPLRTPSHTRKGLTASATPWMPVQRAVPNLKTSSSGHSSTAIHVIADEGAAIAQARAVSARLAERRSLISERSTEAGIYTLEEMAALRSDAAHTPRQVLEWVIGLYRSDELQSIVKVPMHLLLIVEDPQLANSTRNIIGRGSAPVVRLRPLRELHNKVMSVLSRVTPQKYAELRKELLELPLKQCDDDELAKVVTVFFEKAVQEPTYSPLYANLVGEICHLTEAERVMERPARDKLLASRMRHLLLTTCQKEFESPMTLSGDDVVDPVTGRPLSEEDIEHKRDRLKRRLCGNIKFVGELYKQKLLGEKPLEMILRHLMCSQTELEDYRVEGFVTLMKTVAKRCSEKMPQLIDKYMALASEIRASHSIKRITFLLMDLEDLAKRQWKAKSVQEPTTLEDRDRDMADERMRLQEEVERRIRDRRTPLNDTPSGSPVHRSPHAMAPSTPVDPTPAASSSIASRGSMDDMHRRSSEDLSSKDGGGSRLRTHRTPQAANGSPVDYTPPTSPVTQVNPRSPPRLAHLVTMPKSFSQSSLQDNLTSLHRAPSEFSRPSSLPATPKHGMLTIQPRELALSLLKNLAVTADVREVVGRIAQLGRGDRIALVSHMLRCSVTSTRMFEERQRLPSLLLALLEGLPPNPLSEPILSLPDLASTIAEWARFDIESRLYNKCPRMFALWATVVQNVWLAAAASPSTSIGAARRALLEALSPSTFTVMLRELSIVGDRDFLATMVRDFHAATSTVVEQAELLVGKGEDPLYLALMCRMRILPLRIDSPWGRATPTSPSSTSSFSSSHDPALLDTVSQCYSPTSGKVGDDRELEVGRWLVRGVDRGTIEDYMMKTVAASRPVAAIVDVMKCASAMFAAATPSEDWGGGKWREDDTIDVVAKVSARLNDPSITAALLVEAAAHFCGRRTAAGTPDDSQRKYAKLAARVLRDNDRSSNKALARLQACGLAPPSIRGGAEVAAPRSPGGALMLYANFAASEARGPAFSTLIASLWMA